LSAWHNHSGIFDQKTDCWRQTHVTTFEGGALHCFCPRAPKTLVTPLLDSSDVRTSVHSHDWLKTDWKCARFYSVFSQLLKLRISAGKLTIVRCVSHLRRQVEREAAAKVQYRGRGTASDQQSGTHAQTHAAIQAYTQVAKQTHTKELKRETGVSGNVLENPATTSAPANLRFIIINA